MPSEVRIFRATVLLSSPWAQASTTRARRARAGWLRARWASDCSRSRSSSVKIRACLGRPVRIEASYSLDASRAKLAHLFLGQETSLCLRTRQSEWRSSGRGRTDFRRHRTLRRRTMAGRSGARAEKSKLSTATRAAGLHTQAGWEAETVRYTHNPRSGCANGSRVGSRTDI